MPYLADLERHLAEANQLAAFKEKFEDAYGDAWRIPGRTLILFRTPLVGNGFWWKWLSRAEPAPAETGAKGNGSLPDHAIEDFASV